ncbi:hypothetical protein [Amycolatopsis aidingensis]|uniref:hypothetical protein n=1 Tax=Amycolatopsis aidingensis TaxID=2842453 RepID=UPI001C0D2D67|nr:hypothetical protein [Amycolatopsis aidingensis]
MAEVHDGPAGDGLAVPLRLHNLLLALAGRLDDSALSEARELVARSHLDEAAELAAGTLIAGRIPMAGSEQRELALVLEMSRSDPTLVDHVLIDEAHTPQPHRFTGENEPERGVAEALEKTLRVLPDLRSVHAVWRNTPAGSVPGPLPQRVVLVEIGPEAHPPAVAYRVDAALRRAGLPSVVEVTGPWAERFGYHESAYGSANAVWLASSAGSGGQSSGDQRPKKRNRHVSPVAETPAEPARASAVATSEQPEESPAPNPLAVPPARQEDQEGVASTTDMSSAEVAQLRAALAEDHETGRAIAEGRTRSEDVVELPELDLDDPQLSERDRELLRELHAELAERERAEAAKGRPNNGAKRGTEPPARGWADGFSGG